MNELPRKAPLTGNDVWAEITKLELLIERTTLMKNRTKAPVALDRDGREDYLSDRHLRYYERILRYEDTIAWAKERIENLKVIRVEAEKLYTFIKDETPRYNFDRSEEKLQELQDAHAELRRLRVVMTETLRKRRTGT
jgi:hypothetical protein